MTLTEESVVQESIQQLDLKSTFDKIINAWFELMGNDLLPKSILNNQKKRLDIDEKNLTLENLKKLLSSLEDAAVSFKSPDQIKKVFRSIHTIFETHTVLQKEIIKITAEYDIVVARNLGAKMAKNMGFGNTDAVKIATIISELARNIVLYTGNGEITIMPIKELQKGLKIVATDQGPGIKDLESVMNGNYNSERGLGMGLRGVKNLADTFEIETQEGKGTVIHVKKFLK